MKKILKPSPNSRKVSSNDALHQMLPDERGEWRLAGYVGSVRAVWARGLGVA